MYKRVFLSTVPLGGKIYSSEGLIYTVIQKSSTVVCVRDHVFNSVWDFSPNLVVRIRPNDYV